MVRSERRRPLVTECDKPTSTVDDDRLGGKGAAPRDLGAEMEAELEADSTTVALDAEMSREKDEELEEEVEEEEESKEDEDDSLVEVPLALFFSWTSSESISPAVSANWPQSRGSKRANVARLICGQSPCFSSNALHPWRRISAAAFAAPSSTAATIASLVRP